MTKIIKINLILLLLLTIKVNAQIDSVITLKGHEGQVISVAITEDGNKVISTSYDKTVKVWDSNTGKLLITLLGHMSAINCVSVNKNGHFLATGCNDNTAKFWDVKTGSVIRTFYGHTKEIICIALSYENNKIVTGSRDWSIKIWDINDNPAISTLKGHQGEITCLTLSKNGKILISGSNDSTLKIWDVDTGKEIRTYIYPNVVSSVTLSNDETKIITGCYDGKIRILDSKNGDLINILSDEKTLCYFGAISQDNKKIVCSNFSFKAYIWDVEKLVLETTLNGHDDYVNTVAINFNGSKVVTGSDDGTTKIWFLNPKTSVENSTSEMRNNFTFYPNPSSDILNIHLQNEFLSSQKVQLFDLLGQKLLEKDFPIGSDNIEVDISNFLSGIYLLKIGDEVQRVVKR